MNNNSSSEDHNKAPNYFLEELNFITYYDDENLPIKLLTIIAEKNSTFTFQMI
jgi:hypothetical protein